jgi:PIN domain nuclease of toxin-antitoxin system
VKLLLDTHTALWWLTDDPKLSAKAADAIADPANQVLLSAVVVWEVSIKKAIGSLQAPDDLVELLLSGGALPLPLTLQHAAAVEVLPTHKNHADPFDRALIVQAQLEQATVVTTDSRFPLYDVKLLW